MTAPVKIPVGACRGKLMTAVTVAELEAACVRADEKLCADSKGEGAKKLKAFVGAAAKLLVKRRHPVGSYDTTETINQALRDAAEVGHLLAPGDQVAAALPGTAVLISAVKVNPALETFKDDDSDGRVPNQLFLNRVGNLLGISWIGSFRTDNHRNPYIRTYNAEGVWREFDLSDRKVQGNAGVDLTEGSPLVRKLRKNARDRGAFDVEKGRQYIDSTCDTQARLKVVRQLGLKGVYTMRELEKTFYCARLVFTAKTDDPALKPLMAQHVLDRMAPAHEALYGKRAAGGKR